MHDGNHGAFSTLRRVNRIAGWSSDLLGGSSFLWRFKHNTLHHGNTNVVGYDTDIDQMPFARLRRSSLGGRGTAISTCTCGSCTAF